MSGHTHYHRAATLNLLLNQTANQLKTVSIHPSFTQQGQGILCLLPLVPPGLLRPPALLYLYRCSLVYFSSPHSAHQSVCTLTRSLQQDLISSESTRLTLRHYRIERLIKTKCSLPIPQHHMPCSTS